MTSFGSVKIDLFLDGADEKSIAEGSQNSKISGFTTNPSLMRKAGITDYKSFCQRAASLAGGKPISFEVFADDLPGILSQAQEIASWGKNIFVKIPCINTKSVSTAPVIRELSLKGIQLNVTALFDAESVLQVSQSLKGGAPAVVSVFAGRLADSGWDPIPFVLASAEMCRLAGDQVGLLWASTREVYNIFQAQNSGCRVITVPQDVLRKLENLGKTPAELTLDTVETFKRDSESAGFSL